MWHIEYDPSIRLMTIRLTKGVPLAAVNELARAHARALEATGGDSFRVILDLRGLHPLDAPTVEVMTDMKRVAAQLPTYRGRAILVDSATIAMQQHNATIENGGDTSELITSDVEAARTFAHGL